MDGRRGPFVRALALIADCLINHGPRDSQWNQVADCKKLVDLYNPYGHRMRDSGEISQRCSLGWLRRTSTSILPNELAKQTALNC